MKPKPIQIGSRIFVDKKEAIQYSKDKIRKLIKYLDGAVAVNLDEPCPGDLKRLSDGYHKERNLRLDQDDELKSMTLMVNDFSYKNTQQQKVMQKMAEALECNKTFHRLGGIDDCMPCQALKEYYELVGDK